MPFIHGIKLYIYECIYINGLSFIETRYKIGHFYKEMSFLKKPFTYV